MSGVLNAAHIKPLLFALGCLPIVACAGSDAEFHVRFPPDAPRSVANVSVLGVYKDGRLAPEAWETLGAPLTSMLSGACSPGFDDALAVKDLSLSSAIDDYSRANGPTDGLLDAIAPAARGDAILVFSVSGHPPHQKTSLNGDQGTPINAGPMSAPGRRSRGMAPSAFSVTRTNNAYEISASIYSPSQHRQLGFVGMTYTGESTEEAMKAFVERMKSELPRDVCAGWDWKGKVDASAISSIKEE